MKRIVSVGCVVAAFWLVACGGKEPPRPRFALRYEKGWEKTTLPELIRRAGPGDVAIATLGNTAWVSHHVAVVRTEEQPHFHRFHDLTVTVLEGEGILTVDQQRMAMRVGDVAHVQRGTPHFFRNTGKEPAVAFVVFSPPFDGRDVVTSKDGKKGENDGKKGAGKDEKKGGDPDEKKPDESSGSGS